MLLSFCGPVFYPSSHLLVKEYYSSQDLELITGSVTIFVTVAVQGLHVSEEQWAMCGQLLQQPVLWLLWWSANWEGSHGKRVINQLLLEVFWAQTHCLIREAHEKLVYPVFSFGWSLLSPMHVKHWPQLQEEIRDLMASSFLPHNPAKAVAWEGIHSLQFST